MAGTQDLDWDHLPTLGWAVADTDGEAVLHEERGGRLVASMSGEAGSWASSRPRLSSWPSYRTPVIVECRSMRRSSASHYKAARRLFDDREVVVLGENEFGKLP